MRKKNLIIFIALLCFAWFNVIQAKETGFQPALGEIRLDIQGVESAVVTPDGGLAVWASKSGLIAGFPVFEDSRVFVSSPVLADINADGAKEIVVLTRDAGDVFGASVYNGYGTLVASASLGIATAYYDPATLVAASGVKDGFVVGTNEGDALLFTYNNGGLVSEKLASFGVPIAVSASLSGDKIFIASPLNQEIAVFSKNGAIWEKTQTIDAGKPVIHPVAHDEQNNLFVVTADNGLTAINLDSGEKLANFPVALPSTPISSPVITDITSENAGNEISVLMADGKRSVFNQSGGEILLDLPKKSFIESSADASQSESGLIASVGNFGVKIFSKTKHMLGSLFSGIKLVFVGKSGSAPVADNVTVASVSGDYKDKADLKLTYNLNDANGDPVKPITDWRINNSSIAVLNMPFEASMSANTVKDYSTFANHGAAFGDPTWLQVGGHDGFGAYRFDGIDDYLEILDSPGLDAGNTSVSISLWVKTTDKYGWVLNKLLNHQGFAYQLSPGWGGTSLFWFLDGTDPNYSQYSYASKDVTDGQWHHVVGVLNREEGAIRVYVDGQDSSKPVRQVPNLGNIHTARFLEIGSKNDDGFDGIIDDLQIYNRALSKKQITLIYQKKTDVINKKEIILGEPWSACVVPNDGFEDGKSVCAQQVSFLFNNAPTQDAPLLSVETEYLLVSPQNAQDLDNEPVKLIADWRLNDSSVAVLNMPFEASEKFDSAKDYSTFANHGAVFGSPTWLKTGGHDGFGAYQFDGIDDYLEIPDSPGLDAGNTSVSISLWVKTTDKYAWVVNKRIGGRGFAFQLLPGWAGTSLFWFLDGTDPNYSQYSYASKDVTDGQWHHVVGVLNREEGAIRVYVDGQDSSKPVGQVPNLGNISTDKPLRIGNHDVDGGFDGIIDDLQIYNRALSKEQILALFNKENNKLMKTETNAGESYKSCLTPNDGIQDGAVMCTESTTIE